MFEKKVLKQDFVVTGRIPYNLSHINHDQLKNIVFESFSKKDRKTNQITNYQYNHYFLYDDPNVIMLEKQLNDYFRNYAKLDLCLSNKACLYLSKDQVVNSHQQLDYQDLKNSPDYTCYYFLTNDSPSSHILIEYDDIKDKNILYPCKIKRRECVLFNSNLRHSFTPNTSEVPILVIVFQFKLDKLD